VSKFSLLVVLSVTLLTACAADEVAETSSTNDALRSAKRADVRDDGPQLPAACSQSNEDSCLAGNGCAWGDEGDGPKCFYVGSVVAVPGAEPTSPSVCTHNTMESSCLNDPGCAWGDQGKGPECFFVGEIVPYGK